MKIDYSENNSSVDFILLVSWILSCSNRTGNAVKLQNGSRDKDNTNLAADLFKMVSPAENAEYKLNDQIRVSA